MGVRSHTEISRNNNEDTVLASVCVYVPVLVCVLVFISPNKQGQIDRTVRGLRGIRVLQLQSEGENTNYD